MNLSASATKERVRRLEEAEVIQGDGPPDLGTADHPVLRSAEARCWTRLRSAAWIPGSRTVCPSVGRVAGQESRPPRRRGRPAGS
ncbi:hypothetical protein OG342_01170 [Streptomyces bobili]|uniref:hypothetical protein n=1 Tax=Streptomyces bobili TaxID=67280 RepID=UPI002251582D|nr:hypothetical protein [Streptomyces bobili]MCX5521498.1 hypothetical protein [Streptomyces bobili]